ncbi:MAG TPA: glycosyltransferase [Bryobacteraceae bacterium]|nr:glycosyltransferase [Bryobacteraceae bacterium]
MTKIDFIYFDAGGGHRAAATALKTVIEQSGIPWDVRLVNLQEVLHSLDIFRKVTRIRLEDIYNLMLAKGWTLGSAQGLLFMQGVIRLYHGSTTNLLSRHWLESKPDLVVSLVPNFNRTLYQGLRKALPKVPYVTILTDFADYPPHFWMEKQDQYFICGTRRAVEQARDLGHPDDHIFKTSGMILRPTFYQPVKVDRVAERIRLGLDPEKPTGLVLFGGQGSKVMLEIDRRLDDTQLIFVCGKNTSLATKLRGRKARAKRFIEGFTSEIPKYMHISDFFIGKPGPGSISEAVAMKLPVIVERNIWTLPQERYNADWVMEQGAGLVLPNFRRVGDAVGLLLASLDDYRANVEKIENRAVFEIIDILKSIQG